MYELLDRKALPGGSGSFCNIRYKKASLCTVHTWGFGSCAVMTLQSWRMPYEKPDVQEFLKFLETVDNPNWKPMEAYFLITTSQFSGQYPNTFLRDLVKDPTIKLIDRFSNKAHGSNDLNLFRWSKARDFERLST